MARLLLLIAIAVPLWIGWRRFKSLPLAQRKKSLWQVLVAAVLGLILVLAVTGRLPWLMALAAALVATLRAAAPTLLRLLPGLLPTLMRQRSRNAQAAPAADGNSTVATDWLTLNLDHQSGAISGTVRQGDYQGRSLDDLSEPELLALYRCCADHDANSAQLLGSYLDQRLGHGWQDAFSEPESAPSSGVLSETEARAILGVSSTATREEILSAHRRLMQKVHPDRGGNDYLAAQLNRARDCLLD